MLRRHSHIELSTDVRDTHRWCWLMTDAFASLASRSRKFPGGLMAKKRAVVLRQDVKAIRKLCKLVDGCWVPPTSGPVPCRADGDDRSTDDLPTLSPHRWVLSLTHGFTVDPGSSIHVRRKCSTKRCCNPDHLFATTSNGDRLSKTQFIRHMQTLQNRLEAFSPPTPSAVVVRDLDQLRSLCVVDATKNCWIPRVSGRIAMRVPGDCRDDSELPRRAAHRVAFMVAQGRDLLEGSEYVKRRCATKRCCNPAHLYLERHDALSTSATRNPEPTDRETSVLEKTSKGVVVIGEQLDEIKQLCQMTRDGCWLPEVSSQCACRAGGDTSSADALPRMALHRWAWLVANDLASQSLPGDRVHIRRRCAGRLCCNPKHLYPATPDGVEMSIDTAIGRLEAGAPSLRGSPLEGDNDRAEESRVDNDAYLRSVLMS